MKRLEFNPADFNQVVIGALDEVFGALESERFLSGGIAGVHHALGCHVEQIRHIRGAARSADMPGLQWVCSLIERNLIAFYNQNRLLTPEEHTVLGEWPELLASYSLNQSDYKIESLLNYVAVPTWPAPLQDSYREELRRLLSSDPIGRDPNSSECARLSLVPYPACDENDVSTERSLLKQPSFEQSLPEAQCRMADPIESGDELKVDMAIEASSTKQEAADPCITLYDALDALIATMSVEDAFGSSETGDATVLNQYAENLDALSSCAVETGVAELATACTVFAQRIRELATQGRCITEEERARLDRFPMMAMSCIADPANVEAGDALMELVLESAMATNGDIPCVADLSAPDDVSIEPIGSSSAEIISGDNPEAEFVNEVDVEVEVEVNAEAGIEVNAEAEVDVEIALDAELELQVKVDVTHIDVIHETQEISSDMLSLLAKELWMMNEPLAKDLAVATDFDSAAEIRSEGLINYVDTLVRISATAESVGLPTLSGILNCLIQQMGTLVDGLTADHGQLLEQLPQKLASYLSCPTNEEYCLALVALLAHTTWASPLDADAAQGWAMALANVVMIAESEIANERISTASAEDVSIELPHDINMELLEGLLQELPIQVQSFTAAIERFAAGNGTMTDVNQAKRAAHTLKGAANTVGVAGIANLTHHLEDLLIGISNENTLPDKALTILLTEAGDCLEAMSEAVMESGPTPIQAQELMQKVLDYANHVEHTPSTGGVTLAQNTDAMLQDTQDAEKNSEKNIEQGTDQDTEHAVADLPDSAAPAAGQMLRVPALVVDELLRLAGENVISNAQIQERLRQTQKQSKSIQKQDSLFQKLIADLENLVDVRGIAAPRRAADQEGDFDPLEFERYSELHTITSQLIEATTDAREMSGQIDEQLHALGELLEVQRRLQMENQHAVIRTRLVPVSTIISRLQRSVRQTCRLLGKQVDLKIIGEATSIDSNMLHDLTDPLMHVLRNAVDHGIESPAARLASNKSAVAQIELSFAREGNSIVVRCKDDGTGLDYAAIRRTAQQRNMIAADRILSDEELGRLILIPGFSTRDETTQVSGRGIGMDAVHTSILEMKGSLSLRSSPGGLTVELRLPATLLSEHTLMTKISGKLLAISSRRILDIHYITRDQIDSIGDEQVYRVGDAVHRLLKLETLLDLPSNPNEATQAGFPVLLTDTDSGVPCAILVHELVDGREVVVKKLGRYVPKIQGTIGAVILGDGSVAPVIDLPELLRASSPQHHAFGLSSTFIPATERPVASVMRTALVIDDSLTARRVTARIMKDAGYAVQTAIDGLEAVALLEKLVPDVILVDMEMPRMNGLELTAHVRGSAATKKVPVIMITSRSTEKHRKQGSAAGVDAYLVKPFSEDTLLEHVNRLVTT